MGRTVPRRGRAGADQRGALAQLGLLGLVQGNRQGAEQTAPTHPALATTPNHLHRADGSVVADPLTRIDRSPKENLARVIEALGRDPQLTDHAP